MAHRGQGVIEYAGALILATLIVLTAFTINSNILANTFSFIQNTAAQFIINQAENLG